MARREGSMMCCDRCTKAGEEMVEGTRRRIHGIRTGVVFRRRSSVRYGV
jgi:hypothetical protein